MKKIINNKELQESMARLKEVNKLLKIGDKKDKEVIDIDDEEIKESVYNGHKEYVR